MTKEYLKMADLFEGIHYDSLVEAIQCGLMSGIDNAEYAAHAITSHDELLAEVERLREHLTQVKALCSHFAECGGWDLNAYSEYANANVE